MISLTDNEPEWEAMNKKPGVQYVAYNDHGLVEPYRSRLAQVLPSARRQAELVIVAAHAGPNWGAPSGAMQALAHELLDMGADLYWGHSNPTPKGIELYRGKAIFYSTDDFIDDYMVDKDERNGLSFLFMLEVEKGRIRRISLHPVRIEDLGVRRADEQEGQFLARRMKDKSAALGTSILFHDGIGSLTIR